MPWKTRKPYAKKAPARKAYVRRAPIQQKYKRAPRKYSIAKAGSELGGLAGSVLSKLLGQGEYQLKQNTILKPSSVPYMHSNDNSIRIRHKEFITNVEATTDFSLESYSVNPGLSRTFPFLSSLAQNYEQYELKGLVFYFKSTSADSLNSTNTALGSIILASDYNSLDSSFTTKQGMEATTFSTSARPSVDQIHGIECDTSQSSGPVLRYVRSGAIPAGADIRLYDWCNTQIASSGVQATSVCGELHVAYDVILRNPQLTIPRGLNLSWSQFYSSAVTNSLPLQNMVLNTISTGNQTITGGTTINFPVNSYGNYTVAIRWRGSGAVGSAAGAISVSNCTILKLYDNNTQGLVTNAGTSTLIFYMDFSIKILNPLAAATVQITGAALPVNSNCDLFITKINGNVVGGP